MSEPVNVFIVDTSPVPIAIEGVLVQVYSEDGSQFFTQSTTDSGGQVGFLLPPATYSLRFFKNKVGFQQPQIMTVLKAPLPPNPPNDFNAVGEVFILPMAKNPRLCRCSGFFKDINGGPKPFLDMHFISKFDPLLLEGDAVVTERVRIQTDETGYASIDLIRFGMYEVTLEAMEDTPRLITIPDSSSANLPDVLFPVVGQVSLNPDGPYDLTVGAENELEVTVTSATIAGVDLEGTSNVNISWKSSDESVFVVLVTNDNITLRGIAAGTAELTATRLDESIIRIPNTPIEGVPQLITVS